MSLIIVPENTLSDAQYDRWKRLAHEWLTNFPSETTRTTYGNAWQVFLNWFKRHPSMVTRVDVIAYRDHLVTNVRPATVRVRMAALASLFAQAHAEGLLDRNPTAGVTRPKVAAYAGARWLTDAEARTLLQSPDRSTIEGKRDFAILVLALTTGMRRASMANIRIADLSERGDGSVELRYKPKGGEDQTRPLPAVAWRAIEAYLKARGCFALDDPLFISYDRAVRIHAGKALSGEAIWHLVSRHTLRSLGRHVNPHALRHTAANAAWDTTKDLRQVQDLLGHASATTTEIYLHRVEDKRDSLGTALGARWGIS